MSEGIHTLTSWNTSTQITVATVGSAALLTVAAAVTLTVLQAFNTLPLALFCTGGTVLAATIVYTLVLCLKKPTPALSADLTDDQVRSIIHSALTDADLVRREELARLEALGENQSVEERSRAALYAVGDRAAIIEHLLDTTPLLDNHLRTLGSNRVYDHLANYARSATSSYRVVQAFNVLDEAHQCTLLRESIHDKDRLLTLIEKAPHSTGQQLRQQHWPELFQLADELLSARYLKEVFYSVYYSLSDGYQRQCLPKIIDRCLQEIIDANMNSWGGQVDIITKTACAKNHPIEFLEAVFARKIPNFEHSREVKALFDALICGHLLPGPSLAAIVWQKDREHTTEERQLVEALSFEQFKRVNRLRESSLFDFWSPSKQSNEVIADICFNHLPKAAEPLDPLASEFSKNGRVFSKNWNDFLRLLSFSQMTFLIKSDPHLNRLNRIYGFKSNSVKGVPEELLSAHPHHNPDWRGYQYIYIPAVLDHWWLKASIKGHETRIAALEALGLEEKYTAYFKFLHNQDEQRAQEQEASYRSWQEQARAREQAGARTGGAEGARAAEPQNERPKDLEDWLQTLELALDEQYSAADIRAKAKKMALKYHPDKHVGASPQALEQFKDKVTDIFNSRDKLLEYLERNRLEKTPKCS